VTDDCGRAGVEPTTFRNGELAAATTDAPAAPWSSRKITSHSSVGANPHSAEVTAKLASPIA
jgi:hypothetical protein